MAGSDINRTLSGRSLFVVGQDRNFMQMRKIVRQNQGNVCGNKKFMLINGRWCKRKRVKKVERTDCPKNH